jgi:hypothetical protein
LWNFPKETLLRKQNTVLQNLVLGEYSEFKTNTKNAGKVKINKYWEIRNKSGSITSDAIRT